MSPTAPCSGVKINCIGRKEICECKSASFAKEVPTYSVVERMEEVVKIFVQVLGIKVDGKISPNKSHYKGGTVPTFDEPILAHSASVTFANVPTTPIRLNHDDVVR